MRCGRDENGISTESCAASVQPESTTNDDDEDEAIVESIPIAAAAAGTTAAIAEADSNEPSPKKALMLADSSVDVDVVVPSGRDDIADDTAEAEPKASKEEGVEEKA